MAKKMGWKNLGKQKNESMLSFLNDATSRRLNVYLSTMTVTVQNANFTYDKGLTFREVDEKGLREIFDKF